MICRIVKLDVVLVGFLEIDFMIKYKDVKLEVESLVVIFKVY